MARSKKGMSSLPKQENRRNNLVKPAFLLVSLSRCVELNRSRLRERCCYFHFDLCLPVWTTFSCERNLEINWYCHNKCDGYVINILNHVLFFNMSWFHFLMKGNTMLERINWPLFLDGSMKWTQTQYPSYFTLYLQTAAIYLHMSQWESSLVQRTCILPNYLRFQYITSTIFTVSSLKRIWTINNLFQ